MTGRPIRAGAAPLPPTAVGTWVIVALAAVGVWASSAAWLAGQAATWCNIRRWSPTDWSATLIIDTLTNPAATWPKATPSLLWLLVGLLTVAPLLLVGWVWGRWWGRQPASDAPHRSLASAHQLRALTVPQRRQTAKRLRASLADAPTRTITAGDAGIVLGRLDRGPTGAGPLLLAGWEDVIVAVMAPRQGKTSSLVVPTILAAPGAVVATSNKTDILDTAALRRRLTGQPVWVFDPQAVAHTRQDMWWNPLAGVDGVEAAERLAGHFLTGVRSDKDPTWHSAATELLGGLFLAAALGGQEMSRVYQWLHTEAATEAPAILRRHGFHDTAASLLGLSQLPHETRGSVFFTARAGAACLRNPDIVKWVSPRPDLPQFHPAAFVATRETLYLLSKDGGGSAAPLTTAFADAVIRAGERAGTAAGGRLDPPLTMTLDEAANVVRIKDLPELASHAGSRGVIVMVILQSFPQGERVWSDGGMKALWSAATIKLVGPGQDDDTFLDGVSKLVGEQWVTTSGHSISHGGRHGSSTSSSTSTTRQRILDPGALRALPFGSALLIPAAAPSALLRLQPAYLGPHRQALAAAAVELREQVAANATSGGHQ